MQTDSDQAQFPDLACDKANIHPCYSILRDMTVTYLPSKGTIPLQRKRILGQREAICAAHRKNPCTAAPMTIPQHPHLERGPELSVAYTSYSLGIEGKAGWR